MSTQLQTSHIKGYINRAASAHTYWVAQTHRTNAQIKNVSELRANGMRKAISDSNMRYTELMNLASDWAFARHSQGFTIPVVSPRVPLARQAQALRDIQANQDADWLNMLVLSADKTASLRNTLPGDHHYGANWLLAHDTRWGVAILETIGNRMAAAGLFD